MFSNLSTVTPCSDSVVKNSSDKNYITKINITSPESLVKTTARITLVNSPTKNNNRVEIQTLMHFNNEKRGSTVHLKPEEPIVPYCCTGKDLRYKKIRFVVNHR